MREFCCRLVCRSRLRTTALYIANQYCTAYRHRAWAISWCCTNRFGLLKSKALVNSTQADELLARCSGMYMHMLLQHVWLNISLTASSATVVLNPHRLWSQGCVGLIVLTCMVNTTSCPTRLYIALAPACGMNLSRN